jgi:serine phosphatase RsbU (regulator of sigma subunit)
MDYLKLFHRSLAHPELEEIEDVRQYLDWRSARAPGEQEPALSQDDDVELRTYLMHLRLEEPDHQVLERKRASLRQFYAWAAREGLIESNPFEDYDLLRPLLTAEQIRRREEVISGDPGQREIARLNALNRLFEAINRSPDVRSMLQVTLDTVVEVMGLRTAWAFLWAEAGADWPLAAGEPHDFLLAAYHNLPPGLERGQQDFLRQPPDCHCQHLLRSGRLTRAVNVVECSRLQRSASAQGDNRGLMFHASVPLVVGGQPCGILNFAAQEWQFLTSADLQLLTAVGSQVSAALERARLFDWAEEQRRQMQLELEMARAVQASLLPDHLPDIPGFGLAADWRAARQVGGDFYDVFPLSGDRWGLVVADVVDKGAPAALYMSMTRGLIRSRAERTSSPAAILSMVNRDLHTLSSSGMFVTVFCAVLEPRTRRLTFANAGHNPPLLRRPDGGIRQLIGTGPLLGVYERIDLEDVLLILEPGEALLAYTDGLTEALNPGRQEYGAERLLQVMQSTPTDAAGLLGTIRGDLEAFMEGAPQADDVTLVALSCWGGES